MNLSTEQNNDHLIRSNMVHMQDTQSNMRTEMSRMSEENARLREMVGAVTERMDRKIDNTPKGPNEANWSDLFGGTPDGGAQNTPPAEVQQQSMARAAQAAVAQYQRDQAQASQASQAQALEDGTRLWGKFQLSYPEESADPQVFNALKRDWDDAQALNARAGSNRLSPDDLYNRVVGRVLEAHRSNAARATEAAAPVAAPYDPFVRDGLAPGMRQQGGPARPAQQLGREGPGHQAPPRHEYAPQAGYQDVAPPPPRGRQSPSPQPPNSGGYAMGGTAHSPSFRDSPPPVQAQGVNDYVKERLDYQQARLYGTPPA